MAEEGQVEQLSLPDTDSGTFSSLPTESEKFLISVNEGASVYTGPLGSRNAQHLRRVPQGARANIRLNKVVDGISNSWVEFESPPEIAGVVGWIARKSSDQFK